MTYKNITLPTEYDWDFAFRKAFRDPTTERHQRLVAEALSRYGKSPIGYELFGVAHNNPINDFYCLKVHEKEELCIISTSSLGKYYASSIFPITYESAALKHFVNLLTNGEVKINWSLFL